MTERIGYKGIFIFTCAAVLALTACAKKEKPLPGLRLDIRAPRAADGDEKPTILTKETQTKTTQLRVPATRTYSEWTHKNGSPAHRVSNPALRLPMVRAWAQNIGSGNAKRNRLTSEPIIAAERIFTLDSNAQLRAFSRGGASLWTVDLTPPWDKKGATSGGGVAFGNGVVAVTTGYGEVLAVDPATGAIRWRHRTNAAISAAPLVLDGAIIAVSLNNIAVALELENGRVRWQIQSGGSITALAGSGAPAGVGNFVILPFPSGELVGANTKTGARTWSAAVSGGRKGIARGFVGAISGDPVIEGDTIYAANQVGRLISVNRKTGERNWTSNNGAYGPVWVTGDSVFMVTDNFELKRLSAASGLEMWAVTLPGYVKPGKRKKDAFVHYGPVLAGNRLIVASSDGEIRSFNPNTGAELDSVKIQGGAASQPAIVGGTFYILSGNGQLQAFR